MPSGAGFDFDFGAESRADLLAEANRLYRSLHANLGDESKAATPTELAAERLLAELGREVAEFASFPEVLPLKPEHFELHGMKTPTRFTDLSRDHRFFWVRFPLTLRPLENRPFVKLQCGVEFNPGVSEGHLRPVAQMILPDRKFQSLLEANTRVTLAIGEDFEFKAAGSADMDAAAGGTAASAKGAVDAKLAASAGFTAGPFSYTLKRARVDHSPTGTEKVFWSLDGAEFFEEQEPVLVVVMRVPKEAREVRVAAALQASHEFKLFAAPLGAALAYLGERIASFFRAGAPARHTQVWDLTPRL
jgi:hypothetical protein